MANPYQPPDADVTERACPICNGRMALGYLHSGGTIRWYADSDSRVKKLFGNGEALNKAPITRGAVNARRCADCQAILITSGS